MPGQQDPNGNAAGGLEGFLGNLLGGQTPAADSLGRSMADPRMNPGAPMPGGQMAGGTAGPMTEMGKYIEEMKAAQKRQQMMAMLSKMQEQQGQQAPPIGGASQFAPTGGGQPGFAQGGGSNPGQQLHATRGNAGGIGMPGAPLGYPGGVPGAAAGGGASPANMLQQLAMKRMGQPRARSPYG